MECLIRDALNVVYIWAWSALLGLPMLSRDLPVLVERYYATGGVL